MSCKQGKPTGHVLASKPSSAFSTVSSAASATSAGTSRSGCSKLLFGEIDTSSDRSSERYASVCSFVLCDSSTFLKFWLEDRCRETFLSYLSRKDLASLRLTCHDFGVRAAPALFNDLKITFKTNTFKLRRLADLERLGFYVKTLRMNFPHNTDTFLPPLVDPETGAQLNFTYIPQVEASTSQRPKFGDMTEIINRQWPIIFHSATNIPAFIRAFSSLINLSHLKVGCPGYDQTQRFRRSTVDFALISLRIAVERNNLNALDTLTLSPIHPGGLLALASLGGLGATPRSPARWSRVQKLSISANTLPPSLAHDEPDYLGLLQTYLHCFQPNLKIFKFRWVGGKAQFPIQQSIPPVTSADKHTAFDESNAGSHQCLRKRRGMQPLEFGKLERAKFENVKASSAEIKAFCETHSRTLTGVNFADTKLTGGNWADVEADLSKISQPRSCEDFAEIPIMLSPTYFPMPAKREPVNTPALGCEFSAATQLKAETSVGAPVRVHHVNFAQQEASGRNSLRTSRWLTPRNKIARVPSAAQRVREGLLECEAHLKKVFRGSSFPWR